MFTKCSLDNGCWFPELTDIAHSVPLEQVQTLKPMHGFLRTQFIPINVQWIWSKFNFLSFKSEY